MTLRVPRWALIVLLIVVGASTAIAVSGGLLAFHYLNEVVGTSAEGVSLKRSDLIDALLSERFGQKPPAPAEKP